MSTPHPERRNLAAAFKPTTPDRAAGLGDILAPSATHAGNRDRTHTQSASTAKHWRRHPQAGGLYRHRDQRARVSRARPPHTRP